MCESEGIEEKRRKSAAEAVMMQASRRPLLAARQEGSGHDNICSGFVACLLSWRVVVAGSSGAVSAAALLAIKRLFGAAGAAGR